MRNRQSLQHSLGQILPGARLAFTPLPACPQIELLLLDDTYPRGPLDPEMARSVMDNPLYWIFCWASGQLLAKHLLRRPGSLAGARVLDFGCGSGVVAIAAKLAGAAEVIACDSDTDALAATMLNAAHNGVDLTPAADYHAVSGDVDLILAADVLYDRANLAWLAAFVARSPAVLVADSRVRDFQQPGYREIGCSNSVTVPDLGEGREFGQVRLYGAGDFPGLWSAGG